MTFNAKQPKWVIVLVHGCNDHLQITKAYLQEPPPTTSNDDISKTIQTIYLVEFLTLFLWALWLNYYVANLTTMTIQSSSPHHVDLFSPSILGLGKRVYDVPFCMLNSFQLIIYQQLQVKEWKHGEWLKIQSAASITCYFHAWWCTLWAII